MANDRLIRRASLIEAFGVSSATITRWEEDGLVKRTAVINNENHYSEAAINAMLAAHAHGFGTSPPTFRDLQSRKIVLLATPEVAAKLDFSTTHIVYLVRRGRLAAIQLGRMFKVSAASVVLYQSTMNTDNELERLIAGRVLGVGRSTIDALVASGVLHFVQGGPRTRRISRRELLAYLPTLLPDWIDPRDWIDDVLSSSEKLLYVNNAAPLVGGVDEVKRLMAEQKLRFIRHPQGQKVMILPDSIASYLDTLTPYTRQEIATIFGVAKTIVTKWRHDGLMDVCTLHAHNDPNELWEPCMIAILAYRLTPGMSPSKWIRARLTSGTPLIGIQKTMQLLQVSHKTVMRLVKKGTLHGVLTPGGTRMFSEAHVKHVRFELGAKIRMADGGQ